MSAIQIQGSPQARGKYDGSYLTARRSRFDTHVDQEPFCVEFACIPGFPPSPRFLPQSKTMQIRSSGYSNFPIGLNITVNGCLSLCAMDKWYKNE